MIAGRMLIRDDVDEVDRLARRYEAGRQDRSRVALTIVTSLGCNFDCPYCFEAKHDSIVDDDVKRAILDVVDDQIDGGITALSVTWFGFGCAVPAALPGWFRNVPEGPTPSPGWRPSRFVTPPPASGPCGAVGFSPAEGV